MAHARPAYTARSVSSRSRGSSGGLRPPSGAHQWAGHGATADGAVAGASSCSFAKRTRSKRCHAGDGSVAWAPPLPDKLAVPRCGNGWLDRRARTGEIGPCARPTCSRSGVATWHRRRMPCRRRAAIASTFQPPTTASWRSMLRAASVCGRAAFARGQRNPRPRRCALYQGRWITFFYCVMRRRPRRWRLADRRRPSSAGRSRTTRYV